MNDKSLAAWRRDYTVGGLTETDLADEPHVQLARWLSEAQVAGLHEPNAMVLCTTAADRTPSARIVLLKGLDEDGLVFYTNYESRKSLDLTASSRCAALFPWHPLERQVRVEGVARRVPADVSDRYFATRPRGAQLGAWASPQSSVVTGREVLDREYDEAVARWPQPDPVPRPPNWGGFVVEPTTMEFWQGRVDRMHDRLRYRRTQEGTWTVERLAP